MPRNFEMNEGLYLLCSYRTINWLTLYLSISSSGGKKTPKLCVFSVKRAACGVAHNPLIVGLLGDYDPGI